MKKSSPLRDKSFKFAVEIVNISKVIMQQQREYDLTRQLIRSGTSIGANIEEAQQAQSKKDFISKLSISLKESNETRYWIRILQETHYLDLGLSNKLLYSLDEIIRMLTSSIKTTKSSIK